MGLELGTLRSRVICPTNWTSPRHPSFLPILSITVVITFPKQWFLKVTPLYQKNLQRLPAIHKTVQNAEMRIQGSREGTFLWDPPTHPQVLCYIPNSPKFSHAHFFVYTILRTWKALPPLLSFLETPGQD